MGPAQQVADLEKKIKELEDAGAQQAAENLSLKASHFKEVEELKSQMTMLIDERIHLADQLAQFKKSNITIKEKYEALRTEKKGNIFKYVKILAGRKTRFVLEKHCNTNNYQLYNISTYNFFCIIYNV